MDTPSIGLKSRSNCIDNIHLLGNWMLAFKLCFVYYCLRLSKNILRYTFIPPTILDKFHSPVYRTSSTRTSEMAGTLIKRISMVNEPLYRRSGDALNFYNVIVTLIIQLKFCTSSSASLQTENINRETYFLHSPRANNTIYPDCEDQLKRPAATSITRHL